MYVHVRSHTSAYILTNATADTRICRCSHTLVHALTIVCAFTRTHILMYSQLRGSHTHTHSHSHSLTQIRMLVHSRAQSHTLTHTCMLAHARICIYTQNCTRMHNHTGTHTHLHTHTLAYEHENSIFCIICIVLVIHLENNLQHLMHSFYH